MLYSGLFFNKIGRRFQQADETEGELTAMAQENFTGVRVVRAFGREKFEIDRFEKKNNQFADMWIRLGHVLGLYWGIGDFFSNLQVMIIVVAGCFQASIGQLTDGEFLAFVAYNAMLVWPVRNFGRILSELSKTKISIGRLLEILKAQPEKDAPNAQTPPMDGDIVFREHVWNIRFYRKRQVYPFLSFRPLIRTKARGWYNYHWWSGYPGDFAGLAAGTYWNCPAGAVFVFQNHPGDHF